MRSPALTSGRCRVPSSLTLPAPAAITCLAAAFLGRVGNDDPADLLFAFVKALDDDAVVERSDIHGFRLQIERDCVDRTQARPRCEIYATHSDGTDQTQCVHN
mgnify:CR=1 FL=1